MANPSAPTAADLDRILEAHPKLSSYGYDHPGCRDPRELAAARDGLRNSLDQVQAAYAWLQTLHPIADGKPWPTSYGLKHDGEHAGTLGYVTNGAMIAAALLAEVPIRIHPNSPNPGIGLSVTPPRPTPPAGSFTAWLSEQESVDHPIGDLARDVAEDDCWPVTGTRYEEFAEHIRAHGGWQPAVDALREAWEAYSGSPAPDEDDL